MVSIQCYYIVVVNLVPEFDVWLIKNSSSQFCLLWGPLVFFAFFECDFDEVNLHYALDDQINALVLSLMLNSIFPDVLARWWSNTNFLSVSWKWQLLSKITSKTLLKLCMRVLLRACSTQLDETVINFWMSKYFSFIFSIDLSLFLPSWGLLFLWNFFHCFFDRIYLIEALDMILAVNVGWLGYSTHNWFVAISVWRWKGYGIATGVRVHLYSVQSLCKLQCQEVIVHLKSPAFVCVILTKSV